MDIVAVRKDIAAAARAKGIPARIAYRYAALVAQGRFSEAARYLRKHGYGQHCKALAAYAARHTRAILCAAAGSTPATAGPRGANTPPAGPQGAPSTPGE